MWFETIVVLLLILGCSGLVVIKGNITRLIKETRNSSIDLNFIKQHTENIWDESNSSIQIENRIEQISEIKTIIELNNKYN